MHVCMYACMYVCTYVCMYVCMYVCTYVCACVRACVHACMHMYAGADPEEGGGDLYPLNFWEEKIIKNVKNILKLMEIRTKTRIYNFNLKGGLVCKIYVWGRICSGLCI